MIKVFQYSGSYEIKNVVDTFLENLSISHCEILEYRKKFDLILYSMLIYFFLIL